MRIQDFKVVYICPDHNEKYHKRKLHMDKLLREIGFTKIVHFKSGNESYPLALNRATVTILKQNLDEPIFIMEDDIEFTGINTFKFEHDTDAIYFGLSKYGGHPTLPVNLGSLTVEPYNETQVRVKNMLAAHCILYISRKYKEAIINAIENDMDTIQDVTMSRVQPYFKVLANRKPSFYQSRNYNSTSAEEEATLFQLVGVPVQIAPFKPSYIPPTTVWEQIRTKFSW